MKSLKDTHPIFSDVLINWYRDNKRELPWRNTQDPYRIWLSEIILQQTRVAQGLNYYLKFIDHYPSVKDLANATEEEVLKDWQGLGYYSRARNLHKAAKFIVTNLNGSFPSTFPKIKELSGVGDYTASAIASFSFNLPEAVVDGNVYRVLSRIYGISTPIDSTMGKKEFTHLAKELLNINNPAEHNQAIMEFGALQCVPKKPNCSICPFINNCFAYNENKIDDLPLKEKKLKQRVRHLNYLILESNNKIAVNLRDQKGIWQNLYDFPLIETDTELDGKKLLEHAELKKILSPIAFVYQVESAKKKHILSHQILYAKFYHFTIPTESDLKKLGFKIIEKSHLKELPIPKLIENYLNEETNLLSLLLS